jgi:hypothetical protein
MTLPGLIAANNLSDVVDRERAWDNLGDSISADFPIPPLSLDLNFAANKSLVDAVTGASLVTLTRASSKMVTNSARVLETVGIDVPAFDHNPTTGESLGLLVEEARTNVALPSADYSGANWIKTNIQVSASTTTAPDGSTCFAYEGSSASNLLKRLRFNFTTTTVGAYTWSIYVKAGTEDSCAITLQDGTGVNGSTAVILLTNGTVTTAASNNGSNTGATVLVQTLSNGFYRINLTSTFVAALTQIQAIITWDGNFSSTTTGTLFPWGAQLEAGAFPTSYIATTGATATRAADVATITGSNFSSWYNQSQGTIYCEWRTPTPTKNSFAAAVGISGNGNNRFLGHPLNTSSSIPKVEMAIGLTNFSVGNTGDQSIAVNGAIGAGLGANINAPTYPNDLLIGFQFDGGSNYLNGTIARLTFSPVRSPDLALQYITSASGSPSSATYPYTFTIKGKDTLALNSASNASTRDFVLIKGLRTSAQPRLTTAALQVASGVDFQRAAMLKLSPTTSGDYFFSSGITLSGVSTGINGTRALSIATSPFSGSTATASILLRELQPQASWRVTEPMPSGTIASPEFAIPFETSDFMLFMKAGQS